MKTNMEDSMDAGGQWRDSEVLDLIGIWGDTSVQVKLEGSYRNRSVFEEISKEMSERGHRRTWLQCQCKVKSLKAKYKEAKDSNQRSGRGRATCPFYEELERILGDKPSVQPLELLDSPVAVTEDEPETPESETSSAGTDADTGESLLSTSCVSGDASSPQQSTETCEKATAATKSSETKSSKSRKRDKNGDST